MAPFYLRHKSTDEIPEVLRNKLKYDYPIIIKELPKEFDGLFECLG